MLSYYTGVNLDLLSRLPLTARRVLEIGCGAGNLGRAYLSRNPSALYMGIELFDEAAAQARTHLDHVIIGDIEQEDTLSALDEALAGEEIDVLIFGDVLEHLRDPWSVLASLRERISPGGVCVACIPNVAHWSLVAGQLRGNWDYADSGLLDRTHLRFFTLESAEAMFRQAGWSVADANARVLWPEKTEAALKAFAPAAAALGANDEVMRRNLSAFQWVIRAVNGSAAAQLQLSAMTVTKMGGVTDARIEEPLTALGSRPSIAVRWAAQRLAMPRSEPGVLIFHRQLFDTASFVDGVEQAASRGWALVSEHR